MLYKLCDKARWPSVALLLRDYFFLKNKHSVFKTEMEPKTCENSLWLILQFYTSFVNYKCVIGGVDGEFPTTW